MAMNKAHSAKRAGAESGRSDGTDAPDRKAKAPKGHAAGTVRQRWRDQLAATFPYGDESLWREQDAWAPTWDRVAREFREALPLEVQEARALEETVANIRRRVEIAFVTNDGEDVEAKNFVRRLRRAADEALGVPRAPRKRRRYHLMRFLDICVSDRRRQWPDFEALAGGEPDEEPEVDENGWVHTRGLTWLLREWLVHVGDVSNIPKWELDELVAAWREKRPGAKASGQGRVGAYATLERFLKKHWSDRTTARQLKKEWQAADPKVKRKGSQ